MGSISKDQDLILLTFTAIHRIVNMTKILLCISLLLSLSVNAEYRVFKLKLSGASFTKEIMSTLDAYQYTSYYPVGPDVSIEYLDSWLCLGDTSNFLKYCEKPQGRDTASLPNAEEG